MKRAMARAARGMATATKRATAIDDDTTNNGHGKEGGRRLTAATMRTAQRTRLLMLRLERGG
jgi:hypothetical protein